MDGYNECFKIYERNIYKMMQRKFEKVKYYVHVH